jgi:3-oxoacyl-[acyl-carrier protein] reductase
MPSARLTVPDLADKAILITGASTGIGAAVARAFGAQGAKVGVHYNATKAGAEAVANDIAAAGGEAFIVKGDVSRSADTRRVVEETAAHFGRLDGLINNAGLMVGRVDYADVTDEHFDAVINLNARSVVIASKTAIPWLKKSRGFIINTSSIAARNGARNGAGVYGSAKAFVSNVTRGLARELVDSGIRVNAVAPGIIETPFHERYSSPEMLKKMVTAVPLGRAGMPEECVGAYLFLASAALSGYIIGQVIEVNGGQLMP